MNEADGELKPPSPNKLSELRPEPFRRGNWRGRTVFRAKISAANRLRVRLMLNKPSLMGFFFFLLNCRFFLV